MVLYDKLWNTMKAKGITQYRLINYYGMSSGQLCRLRNNEYVSTHTIEVLCTILNCPVEDVMEVRPDDSLAPIMNGELRQR
jgi:putative transcriptional regulator